MALAPRISRAGVADANRTKKNPALSCISAAVKNSGNWKLPSRRAQKAETIGATRPGMLASGLLMAHSSAESLPPTSWKFVEARAVQQMADHDAAVRGRGLGRAAGEPERRQEDELNQRPRPGEQLLQPARTIIAGTLGRMQQPCV